ncbi:cytoplasmic tRNA 2-thiolation protein 1-like [Varroa jacobsoni]|uniref:cytoplasmic tRNA 2-thiolation protein 1-like n=1 Tax=Varroa jacobsoni TaxID=62625 RepID=UPI000BF47504|nr:cytoplasmic tRNA 2-thiolation protein 1-like [Varroa jacobsoni]
MKLCTKCSTRKACLKRPKTGDPLCKECFFEAFEEEIHWTITTFKLFNPGEYVAIAASGGKDSTVLAHVIKLLNDRYGYGIRLVLLSIDEGITGYRDDSLETVKRNEHQYNIPLKILSYKDLYGWTMDKIVAAIGKRSNCTFCGVFRRQALDRGAMQLGVTKMVTGHNADDIAETVIMNILRGDIARLRRCTSIVTGSDGLIPRSKPFKYTYEKEIVMYAHFKKLDYFSTECIYSPNAYRGHARAYIKNLELQDPLAILNIIYSGECMDVRDDVRLPSKRTCKRCGYISSQEVCKACVMLEGLNKGIPRLGVGKTSKVNKKIENLKISSDRRIKGGDELKNVNIANDSNDKANKCTNNDNQASDTCKNKIKSSLLKETTLDW